METRRVKRIKIELEGKIEIPKDTKEKIGILKEINFKTHDVSPSGALLISTHYLPKSIKINLLFSGNKKLGFSSIKIPSEIAHCKFDHIKRYKLGVKFLKLEEKQKKFIESLLERYS